MLKQKIALITGINSGLGIELTKQYSTNNYQVFGCCKDLQASAELLRLTKRFPYIKLFQADITSPLDLEAIAEEVGTQPIDILINNETIAPLNVIEILYGNILAGQQKIIVNLSYDKTNTALKTMALDLHEVGMKVLSFYLAEAAIPAEKIVASLINVITNYAEKTTAPLLNYKGEAIPW